MISDDDCRVAVKTWLNFGKSRRKAREALGLSHPAMQRRLEAAEARGIKCAVERARYALRQDLQGEPEPKTFFEAVERQLDEPEPSAFDKRLVALQDENSTLRRELKQAVRDSLDTEKVRREIIGISGMSPNPPTWTTDLDARDHSGPGIPMVLWSDWHWGEVVRSNEVGGVNEFNLAIAKARCRKMVDKIVKLAFQHQVHHGYPGIIVSLNGDMIGGEIHQELADTNELKTIPAVLDIFNTLIAMLEEMAKHFGNVFVTGIVGNHGRNTLKPRAKSRVYTSYEWLLYIMLERYFAERNPKVRFFVPSDIDALVKVNSTRYLFTHGDALGTRGGDGIIGALGPIMRGKIKTSHSNAQVGRDFDTLVIGHWHQYLPLPGLIVNGALKGYDEFARTILRATFQRPIQAMWYDHPKVGITKHEPLYLEDQLQVPTADGGWVSWAV
jgi:hypothetical protein